MTMASKGDQVKYSTNPPHPREDETGTGGDQEGVVLGPDLQASRTPLDKKLYRQILLPNGLRCLLIQDTIAMVNQGTCGLGVEEDEDDDDEDEEEEEEVSPEGDQKENKDKDADDDEKDDEEEEKEEEGGIRDAAAAILVGTGSMYDPPHCQGLAHFLEHLLFMGSEKYPTENEYDSFVSKHGGSDNAWTEWEHTIYSLEIPQEYLWPALDRLAQFFVAPLMLESAVDRELQAIESEFQLNKNSDACRWEQLLCATADPAHPLAKFAWGNVRSLRDIPHQLGVNPLHELRKFYNQYYYAANMRVVVMGAYTLDVLQAMVVELFAPVPALPREPGPFPLPVDPEHITSWASTYQSPMAQAGNPLQIGRGLQTIYRVVPIRDKHSVTMTWPLPSLMQHWKCKPVDYIAHLIGHEASGSLLSLFKSHSWATGCVAGVGEDGFDQASSHFFFCVTFTLSREGLEAWKSIVEYTYMYLAMLRRYARDGSWPAYIYEELRNMEEVSHRFADEPSPDSTVENLVAEMAPHYNLPPERLLDGSNLLFEFDSNIIREILEKYLIPENFRIDLMSSTFHLPENETETPPVHETETILPNLTVLEADDSFTIIPGTHPAQLEPMFGTRFWCHAMSREWLEHLSELSQQQESPAELRLPDPNPYVPSRFDLKALPEDDAHHPLLNCSLKLCITVGKTKQWFPATAIRYNQKKNSLLMSYESEDETWHTLDDHHAHFKDLTPDFEGTMDDRKVKYRLIAVAVPGQGAVRKFGDDSDLAVEDGKGFPPIPPVLPASRLPKEISNTNILKMWWLQDRNFHRPIAELRLQLFCGQANSSPLHQACAELVECLCVDELTETAYMAQLSDLGYSIEAADIGFYFRVHGFDDKLMDLFCSAISLLLSFRGLSDSLPAQIKKGRYDACVEIMERRYNNSGLKASSLCANVRVQALRPTIWSCERKLKALKSLNVNTFVKTASAIMEHIAVEALLHGNVDRADAEKAKNMILALVSGSGLPRKKYPGQPVLRIPTVEKLTLITVPSKDPTENNTAVEVYIQVGKDNLKERVLIDLLVQMLSEPLFDQIRTKEQFGYDVCTEVRWTYGIMGLMFKVVTNVRSAAEVVDRVDKFLIDYRRDLDAMTIEEFLEHQIGLAKSKLDMFNSLTEETDAFWDEIRDGRFEWQSWRDEAVCLRTITKEEVTNAYDKWLLPGQRRNIMAVQVIGAGFLDRPSLNDETAADFVDSQVQRFHESCKKQVWGRVNSKLF